MAQPLLNHRTMRFAPLLLAAVASLAQAQTASLTIDLQGEEELRVSAADCGTSVPMNWAAVGGGGACEDLKIWVTSSSSCGDAPAAGDKTFDVARTALAAGSGTVNLSLADLVFSPSDGGTGCGATGYEESFFVCGRFTYGTIVNPCGSSPPAVKVTGPPELIYDALAPGAPTLSAVVPNDGALAVRVTAPSDAVSVLLFAKEESQPDSAFTEVATLAATAGQGRITGLTNGVSYSVIAYAEDSVENRSPASAVLTGTPIDSEGFYGTYQRMGGVDEGGCSAAGGGAAASLVVLVFGALMRRRKQ